MAITNHERIGKAMELLKQGLQPFVEREMKAQHAQRWFEEARDGTDLGELHVVVWRGIVSRRGSPPRREGATQVKELVLYPIEKPTTDKVWRSTDGTLYDTATLAARCIALLEEQILADAQDAQE